MRKIAILGSTGSIGLQTLDEVDRHPDKFRVTALSAHSNWALLAQQIRKYRPAAACLSGAPLPDIPEDLRFCRFYERLEDLARESDADDVMVAVVGVAGLCATLSARKSGKRILLANKETLVAGGELVMSACPRVDGCPTLLPVDSEHSAIFQCLEAAGSNRLSRIFLTASGGPFRTWDKAKIDAADVSAALKHPTWNMGRKITVDSASMFNKALEIIEARWLFDAEPDEIEVVIHPQSVVHSMVAFQDGAVLAQLGVPDMRVPILYAMTWPERAPSGVQPPDFALLSSLTFEKPDPSRFPSLKMSYDVLRAGGTAPCVLNAANEVAAEAFLAGSILMGQVYSIVEETLSRTAFERQDSLETVLEADRRARMTARSVLKEII